jgi:hypothetical protein
MELKIYSNRMKENSKFVSNETESETNVIIIVASNNAEFFRCFFVLYGMVTNQSILLRQNFGAFLLTVKSANLNVI